MIIDFHTHCFPDKIAHHAISALETSSGGLLPGTDGTVSGLKEAMRRQNVAKSVVLSIATNARQQTNVNNFAAEINGGDIIAFGSVHPDAPNALEELERIKSLGLCGVKFHPEFQKFFVDDDNMTPIYKKISELGLITVFHAGADLGFKDPIRCTPRRMANALKYLDCPVVAAHWGGIYCYEDTLKYLCGTDIYLDTSFGYRVIPKPYAEEILEKHSPDRILFGSDTPWSTPENEIRLLDVLNIGETEKEKIYFKNAEKLLGI